MWSFYRQWSAIARSTISDRRLLRKLGFLRKQRGGADDIPADDVPVDGIPAGGAPAAPSAVVRG